MKIIVADDHPLIVYAITHKIKSLRRGIEIESAYCYQQLFRLMEQSTPSIDLIITDLAMPGCVGIQGIQYIREHHPLTPIIVISGNDDFESCTQCLDAGATEFISKAELDTVFTSVISKYLSENKDNTVSSELSKTHEYLKHLTPSQKKVLHFISEGYSNKAIARQLNLSEKTIRVHASAIFRHLNVTNRTQAAIEYKKTINSLLN
ncbi:response regulator transcription factor [Pseudoalteromonas pernae]|uniref:response regulator transcription factor n=1 Tax=Pseudoalteromonas pernae TaxID=3118054 RepID=UPI003241F35A